jgi:hypothetical protein
MEKNKKERGKVEESFYGGDLDAAVGRWVVGSIRVGERSRDKGRLSGCRCRCVLAGEIDLGERERELQRKKWRKIEQRRWRRVDEQ